TWEAAYRLWSVRSAGRGRHGPRAGGRAGARGSTAPPPRRAATVDLPQVHELAGLDDWEALVRTADANGGPLRTLRQLVERHEDDVPSLCRALRSAHRDRPSDAPLVIGTVHRAKGREWADVELWSDLSRVPDDADALAAAPDPEAARAEANLLYVAVTRATRTLRLGRLRDDLKGLLGLELP
ncbi:MAG: hypothetical protein WD336_07860, partial [Trueperaceae bacterium]